MSIYEKTLLIIKPDGVKKKIVGEIIRRFEDADIHPVEINMSKANFEQMDNHYPKSNEWIERLGNKTLSSFAKNKEPVEPIFNSDNPLHIGQQVRAWLIEYMISGPIVKIIMEGVDAINRGRKIVGHTIPALAEPNTIRCDFSDDTVIKCNLERRSLYNVVHISETKEEAKNEINIWFSNHS